MVQSTLNRELGLNQALQSRPHSRYDNLSAFRVEVAAEALKVGAEQDDVAANVFLCKSWIR